MSEKSKIIYEGVKIEYPPELAKEAAGLRSSIDTFSTRDTIKALVENFATTYPGYHHSGIRLSLEKEESED